MRLTSVALLMAACGDNGGDDTASNTNTVTREDDFPECHSGDAPEVFLGKGVGGAFEPLEVDATVGLTSAPQGGQGVSVLLGTRGIEVGHDLQVTVTAESSVVENSFAEFTLVASLECKSDGPDGPQGVVYGVVIGFSSSLGNSDLLAMNGEPATLTVSVTDSNGSVAETTHRVILAVGE
jgi:hypothetical protein